MENYGQLTEYQADIELIENYEQRPKMYLEANDVPDVKRVPVFLSVIGSRVFSHHLKRLSMSCWRC